MRPEGERKWHLSQSLATPAHYFRVSHPLAVAYYTDGTKNMLRRVSDDPTLASLRVPADTFQQARLPKSRRMREHRAALTGQLEAGPPTLRPVRWDASSQPQHSPAPSTSSDEGLSHTLSSRTLSGSTGSSTPSPTDGSSNQAYTSGREPGAVAIGASTSSSAHSSVSSSSSRPRSSRGDGSPRRTLPPLMYLENAPRPNSRRHPVDEIALMSFS